MTDETFELTSSIERLIEAIEGLQELLKEMKQ